MNAPQPGRDLPINDPPPADGTVPPVQEPPVPHPDPNPDPEPTVQQKHPPYPPNVRPVGPDTSRPAEAIDEGWPDDTNPEAHESAV